MVFGHPIGWIRRVVLKNWLCAMGIDIHSPAKEIFWYLRFTMNIGILWKSLENICWWYGYGKCVGTLELWLYGNLSIICWLNVIVLYFIVMVIIWDSFPIWESYWSQRNCMSHYNHHNSPCGKYRKMVIIRESFNDLVINHGIIVELSWGYKYILGWWGFFCGIRMVIWLVVWNSFYFSIYWE